MRKLIADLGRRYRAHHAGTVGLLQGIGVVGSVAFPGIYLLRFTGKLPPLYDDLPWRLVAAFLCLLLALRKSWPERLQRHYIAYSWFAVFYSLAFLLPYTLLQNHASTPSVANMVVSVVLIILLTDWRNTIVMMVGGYAASIAMYRLLSPDPVLPSSFLVWWVPLSAVLVAGGSISKYVEKRAELERLRSLYTGLAGSIAHEVRNPMAQVQHALQNAQRILPASGDSEMVALPREQIAAMARALAQGEHAVRRGLQAVTMTLQQVSGKPLDRSRFTRLSAATCVRKAVDEYAHENATQRSRVGVEVAEDFTFDGDETACVLVLFNLLRNALYYLPLHPQATITIAVQATPVHRILVRDTGPGIPPERLGELFEEFHSFDKAEGTGLGLSFCRRVMQSFGGEIACRSQLGQFTEFALTFPEALELPPAPPAPAAPAPVPAEEFAGRTVLVVDDSAFNRKIVEARLRELGLRVLEAGHGEEALRLLDEGARPDAILMDMQMPGMSGIDTTRALRQLAGPASRTPVLALSANDLPAFREGALEVGMDGYLTKPLDPQLLRSELARVLGLQAHRLDAEAAL